MDENKKLQEILKAIYWDKFSPSQIKIVSAIINNDDDGNNEKANAICDYLGIERRYNRSAIIEVLNN